MTVSSGKPRARRTVLLEPDHADIVRKAVKATARYYGVRIQDLGPKTSWIREAMRSGKQMTLQTAEILLHHIEKPRPELVGKKRPQGPPQQVAFEAILQQRQSGGNVPPTIDATTEYIGYSYFVHLILSRYLAPLPGSAFFVLPGASDAVAEYILGVLPLQTLGIERRKLVVETLSAVLRMAEKPLKTDLGKQLEPRLTVLAIVNNLNMISDAQDSPEIGEFDLSSIIEAAEAIDASEVVRANSLRVLSSKKPRKTRSVILPKVKNLT